MLKKGILSFVTALGLTITGVMPTLPVSAAETETLTKEVYTNVAQFKKITTTAGANVERLVDGKDKFGANYQYAFGASGATVTVDLGHRYNIKEIQLLHVDGGNGAVYVANKEDGSDKESIGTLSWSESFEKTLDGTKAYRYVIIRGNAYATFRELKVYANQKVTKVSENKTASANSETVYGDITYSASKAVNGTNSDINDAWVATGNGNHYWYVDLEKAQPIGYIEIQGRNGADDVYTRLNKGIYGSNISPADNSEVYEAEGEITDKSAAVRLAGFTEPSDYAAFPYPAYVASSENDTTYKTTVDDSAAYRYLIYKNEKQYTAALGSFKAYVVNPTVTEAAVSGGKATVLFSDEMDESTITSESVTLTNKATGQAAVLSNLTIDGYTMTFDLPYNDDFTLNIADSVKNKNGVSVAKNESYDVKAEDIYNGLPVYTRNYNVALNKPVTSSGLAYGSTSDLVDDNRGTFMYCSFDKNPNQWIQLDLQKRYKINSIKMSARSDQPEQLEASEVEIQASNNADFSDYKVLDTLSASGKQMTKEKDVFTELNGSGEAAYRYVRLYSNTQLGGISEIQVWANQTMTEVSRDKTVIAGSTVAAYKPASVIVDGKSSTGAGDAWFGSWGSLDYFRIDLGAEYPVGAVEIESRYSGSDFNERKLFNVYGHNNDDIGALDEAALKQYKNNTAGVHYTAENGYTKLSGVVNIANTGYIPMPAMNDKTVVDPFYKASIKDENAYRYITYKRTAALTTAIGEMRVMVINPEINNVKSKDGKVTIEFSDEINASSVRANKIIVKDEKENELPISNLTVNGYEISFDVANAPEFGVCNLTVERTIRNTKGVTMAADYSGSVGFGEGISVESITFDKTSLTANDTIKATAVLKSALTTSKDVELIMAVKDLTANELKIVNLDRKTIAAGDTITLETTVTLPDSVEGLQLQAFVWENETLEPFCGVTNFSKETN